VDFAPLLARITALGLRARIDLRAIRQLPPAETKAFGLTDREREILALLARGRTNAQIGTELFISPKTASVHVTNILRKLGVTRRTQAAAIAERAGFTSN
jgi:DNA-binding CsgD family transcriptional regulator